MAQEIRGRGVKLVNEYALSLGEFYENTPKAVFAALAASLPIQRGEDPAGVVEALRREWAALHANGIIPQEPPIQTNTRPPRGEREG